MECSGSFYIYNYKRKQLKNTIVSRELNENDSVIRAHSTISRQFRCNWYHGRVQVAADDVVLGFATHRVSQTAPNTIHPSFLLALQALLALQSFEASQANCKMYEKNNNVWRKAAPAPTVDWDSPTRIQSA